MAWRCGQPPSMVPNCQHQNATQSCRINYQGSWFGWPLHPVQYYADVSVRPALDDPSSGRAIETSTNLCGVALDSAGNWMFGRWKSSQMGRERMTIWRPAGKKVKALSSSIIISGLPKRIHFGRSLPNRPRWQRTSQVLGDPSPIYGAHLTIRQMYEKWRGAWGGCWLARWWASR